MIRTLAVFLASLVVLIACADADRVTGMRVAFIDVGQGDAILIQSEGGDNVLIDAGSAGGDVVSELKRLGVDTIDMMVASHAHEDHIGGMVSVMQAFEVDRYLDNGLPHATDIYSRVIGMLIERNVVYYRADEPHRFTLEGPSNATLTVLPPLNVDDQNNRSVGLLLEYGQFSALFTGDAEFDGIAHFLSVGVPQVTVLKAGHHGSRDAVTPQWIATTRPKVVVISVGSGNAYGHPDPWALRYYGALGATIYRTDLHGTIEVSAQPNGSYTIQMHKRESLPK